MRAPKQSNGLVAFGFATNLGFQTQRNGRVSHRGPRFHTACHLVRVTSASWMRLQGLCRLPYDSTGKRDRDTRAHGRFQRAVEPLSRDFSEYHAEAGVMDFRYPTVRLRKFADFFLTRYIRRTFFGGPTKFKAILENRAPFSLHQALSNEFGKLVLRLRRVQSFLRHVQFELCADFL